jgi:type VII secretion-associated serine protease mycosin
LRKHLRRYVLSALAVGTIAGGATFALPGAHPSWQPSTYGLRQTPASLLPATVSAAFPVRVVSTVLDHGRPVATARTATDPVAAAALVRQAQRAKNALGVQVDRPIHALDAPSGSDPLRYRQWDLAKIDAPGAWTRSTGSGAVVAVVDTGVDGSHPDLAGQVLTGYDEIGQAEGGNTDPNGHGTHVAGTIAALTGNDVGVSSIAPDVKILPVRVLRADGGGYMSDAANGVVYAADHGADVVNLSIGASEDDFSMSSAVAYARSRGVVVVAAAGNERQNGNPVSYPAADAGVIAVAATDSADAVASYSNSGAYVDVSAPGSAIVSTYPTAKNGTGYALMSGTSMASPHVAAVAALLRSADPSLTPDQVESALESSATDLGPAGRDDDYGYGRIDAAAALATLAPPAAEPATSPTTDPAVTPSDDPTASPTDDPTVPPTDDATSSPTDDPTGSPTDDPTTSPTDGPTTDPTADPTAEPTAEPTPEPVTPVITPSPRARLVRFGTTPTTTFKVTADDEPMSGAAADLCVSVNHGTFTCTGVSTDDRGIVTWARQRATAPYRIRLAVRATDGPTSAVSATANYQVQAAVAVTKASARSLSVAIGGVGRQTVTVQRLDGTRWVTVKTFKAAARTTVTGLSAKKSYRVVVPTTATFAGVTSATVKL